MLPERGSPAVAVAGCFLILQACAGWCLSFAQSQLPFGDLRNHVERNSKTHTSWTPPRSLRSWQARRGELRAQILAAAGLHPPPEKTPLKPRIYGPRIVRPTYTIDKVVIETLPGLLVTGNLYLPARLGRSHAAVLVAHGHWKHGRIHHAEDYSVPALCVNLASQGYVVFAWDMLGYNGTRALPHVFGDSQEEVSWSFSPLGIQLWNAIRAIDYLETLDYVDRRRIGMTGASGGGTQTFLTAAVDDRILATAPVDMVSAGFQGDDACEIAPGLRLDSNNVEITALIAPRPLLLVSSTRDWTRNTPHEEFPLIRKVYQLYGRANWLRQAQIDAPHNYNRESRQAVYEFFGRVLRRSPAGPHAERIEVDFPPQALLATDADGFVPQKQDRKAVFASWKELTSRAAEHLSDEVWREAFESASGIVWPEDVQITPVAANTFLSRACCGDRIPVQMVQSGKEGVFTRVEVHEDGMDELRQNNAAASVSRGLLENRLLVDPFQIGSAATVRPPLRGDHLTFHRSDDANRVQDLLTAIAYVAREEGQISVQLQCSGPRLVPLCHIASALSRVPVRLIISDGSPWKQVAIPGLSRLGGMEAVERRRNSQVVPPANLPTPQN